jgi:subtilisin family serine protease
MKYLVIKQRSDSETYIDPAALGDDDAPFRLPFRTSTLELSEKDVSELQRDPKVEDVVPTIPLILVKPLEEETYSNNARSACTWGVEAVAATSTVQTGDGVTIAILDTGIDSEHPAFKGVTFELKDFVADPAGVAGSATDTHGHGTHVAGTIFGRHIDGMRIGVAPGVKRALIGKVLGPDGGEIDAVMNAVEWALRKKADVISMSLAIDFPGSVIRLVNAGYPLDIAASRALQAYRVNIRLFDRLAALVDAWGNTGRGALLVAASGNESRRRQDVRFPVNIAPPAAADGFVSVGALEKATNQTSSFAVADFSNTGCLLSAPGVAITSAKLGGGLVCKSGTSMATPHVAGVAALWIEKLFANSARPRHIEKTAVSLPGQLRGDVGLGLVQAP